MSEVGPKDEPEPDPDVPNAADPRRWCYRM